MRRKVERTIPEPTLAEIQKTLPKSETIHLRVTINEKAEVAATATSMHLSMTEYLLKCHAVVAGKLRKGD